MQVQSGIAFSAWLFSIFVSALPLVAGAPIAHAPIIFALVLAPAILLGIASAKRFHEPASFVASPAVPRLLLGCRRIPFATRLLIIGFALTCLFSFEMRFDFVPNAFGLFELLVPVIVFSALFDLSAGLVCVGLAVFFGFVIFAPPRFPGIIDFGSSYWRTLGSFIAVGLSSSAYFSWAVDTFLAGEQINHDWRRCRLLMAQGLDHLRAAAQGLSRVRSGPIVLGAALIVAYALFWATYAWFSSSGGVHIDSLEAYAWGREFRLGYYKHPPFWAWVAGLWFMIWPKTDWAFWFLSELNGGLGLAGAYALMGRFCSNRTTRWLCLLLLMLTPFYQFNALRFNANTALLSIWPWTLYFFVRSVERPAVLPALACGLLAGMAMLSKYFALVLIGTCFLASLTHHNRRAYFASAAPYLSVLVAALVFAPHLFWLFRDGFQPLAYLATKIDLRDRAISDSFFQFVGASLAFFILPMAVLVLARWRDGAAPKPLSPAQNGPSFENVITFAPFVLTLFSGVAGHAALAIPFGVPIFSMATLALVRLVGAHEDRALAYARALVIAVTAGCALAAPIIPRVFLALRHHDHVRPRNEVADMAIALWKDRVGRPLILVGGERENSLAVTFRSRDDTSEFNQLNMRWSPYVTPDRLRRDGLLVICQNANPWCMEAVKPFLTPNSERYDLSVAQSGTDHLAFEHTVFIIPPQTN